MAAPKGYRVYLDKSLGARSDGFRFVLDMTRDSARKWHRLYCPDYLKMFRVPANDAVIRGKLVLAALNRPSTTELKYDPVRLKKNLKRWAKSAGRRYSGRDLREVLDVLSSP